MKESINISQDQQLTQRLSPRQVQFVRLLEMTAPEVEEEVRQQLDDNPALEVAEEEAGTEDAEMEYAMDADPDDDPADRYAMQAQTSAADPGQWQIAADAPDLMTMLSAQMGETSLPDNIKRLALYIIGNIDQNGYLTRSLSAMADDIAYGWGVEVSDDDMRRAFAAVRQLDPAGVGAVDLRDCLLLQLERKRPSTLALRIAREIVSDYFDLFSKKHYDRLQAQLELDDPEELRKAMDIIRSLNPKPGSAIAPVDSVMRASQITPDVYVEETDDGRWTVGLASRLPQLQVERTFAVDAYGLGDRPMTKGEREAQTFVRMKRDDAEAFINSLRQRGNTILSVAEAIVKRQADFISTGDPAKLRPMILRDIAADTGLDVSMVSRATAGKYMSAPLGTYPLKMFFNEALGDESDTSAHQVMEALRQVIEAEDKKHPLSDQAIMEHMERKGYKVARRTVTKYREKLGIPVGRLRRNM